MHVEKSKEQKQAEKYRVLTQAQPSHRAGIADAVVIKDADLFLATGPDGRVPAGGDHGYGLYFHDCRFLSGYEVRLSGRLPEVLASNAGDEFRSLFELTNPQLGGGQTGRQLIGLRWRHVVDARVHALRDEIIVENYDTAEHALSLQLDLEADFRDIFAVRGVLDRRPGELQPVEWQQDTLVFSYRGADQTLRQLRVRFSEPPSRRQDGHCWFDVQLRPHQPVRLVLSLAVAEAEEDHPQVGPGSDELHGAEDAFQRSLDQWMQGFPQIDSDNQWLDSAMRQSLRDLRALRAETDGYHYVAAGIPWFATLFGRDSMMCALQMLAYRPQIAAETLRLLARLQGTRHDQAKDEEPGKILHELRVGEFARMGEIPYTPYYGSVDSTPLFLILLGEYTRWTGDLTLFRALRPSVERALRWIDEYGDHDGDGYVDYQSDGTHRLINQGWKDSGNSIVDARGQVAEPPIALVEVQGYVFRAKMSCAWLFQRAGDPQRGQALTREAEELKERFNRDYWLPDKGFYALALQRGGQTADAISSNPGQALWTGIVSEEHAAAVAARLMAPDMYSGWGVRTLSTAELAYNPVAYHLGTVWPHDNALIAAGLRRHGYDEQACRIFSDLLAAASNFEGFRLPEVFSGFSRDEFGVPVRYPVACHPQAWASGSIPFLLQDLLGLLPDPTNDRLRIRRPRLPKSIRRVHFGGLRVGDDQLDLLFERTTGDKLTVEVLSRTGRLDVAVEDS